MAELDPKPWVYPESGIRAADEVPGAADFAPHPQFEQDPEKYGVEHGK